MNGEARLPERLSLRPGLICLTGSGGKTTLAHLLAKALPGRVIFCTSTRIYPSKTLPVYLGADEGALDALLERFRAVCVGTAAEAGKLSAPRIPFSRLRALAAYVLVEADGSRGLPLKAHLPHEPALPENFDRNILLAGASGFFRPVSEAAHRPERFCALSGLRMEDPATPEAVASVLRSEGGFDTVLVAQCSRPERLSAAHALAALLEQPVFAEDFSCAFPESALQ